MPFPLFHFRTAQQQQRSDDFYFNHTIAIELNNVGAALYKSGDHSAAIELYSDATKAMMAIDSNKKCDLTDICRGALIERIVRGKEKLHNATETKNRCSPQTTLFRLDLYPMTLCGSNHDNGPQYLQEALMIDLPPPPSENVTQNFDNAKVYMDSAIILYNMGLVHQKNCSLDTALQLFQLAQSTMPQSSQSLVIIAVMNNIGYIRYECGYYCLAMENFKVALEHCQRITTQRNMSGTEKKTLKRFMGTVLSNMGRIHFVVGQYDEALIKCTEAMVERHTTHHTSRHIDAFTTFYNLGLTYHQMGEIEGSLEMFRQYLHHVASMSSEDMLAFSQDSTIELAASLDHVGKTFGEHEMFLEAMECYRHALRLGSEYINTHRIFADVLYNTGMVHFQTRNHNKALKVFRYSLSVLRSSLGKYHPKVAAVLHQIGTVQLETGLLTEALQSLTESVELKQKVLHSDDHSLAESLYQIGRIYQERGEYLKALSLFEKTLRMERMSLGIKHIDVAITLFRIGQTHYQRGHLDNSLNALNEALSIMQTKANETDIFVSNILFIMGDVYSEKGNVSKAMECFTKAARSSQREPWTSDRNNLTIIMKNTFQTTLLKNTIHTAPAA